MTASPKVSVIIPAHNIEQYIPECLESLINQTYANYEVLVVENGSKDNTYSIAKGYVEKDSRIKVFKETIKGVMNARNKGLAEAEGDFIMFIDGDDFIANDYLEVAVASMKDGIDLAILPYALYTNGHVEKYEYLAPSGVYEGSKGLRFFALPYVWGKVFRKEIIEKHNLKYDTSLAHVEDLLFSIEYLLVSDSVYLSSADSCYFYRQAREGQTTSTIDDYINAECFLKVASISRKLAKDHKYEDMAMAYANKEFAIPILGRVFGASPLKRMSTAQVKQLLEPYKDEILSIELDERVCAKWLIVWWNRFRYFVRKGKYGSFFKFVRHYRNFILQPLGIKYVEERL